MEYLEFLKGLLSNPRAVSSPTPSSAALAAAIAQEVDPAIPGTLIELGAGTGAITQALLNRGFAQSRILAVECEPVLARSVARRFPDIRVVCADAFTFRQFVPRDVRVCAVVSGLPMLNFAEDKRRALLSDAMACQSSGGRFIQLSYSWRPPIDASEIQVQGAMIWKNFPPAHIWVYRSPQVPLAA
jgi:phosphatidylethanolamine/phosphatidyl-N-methylethanolamine N-methyltransferase